jgi:replicative DNA helicase
VRLTTAKASDQAVRYERLVLGTVLLNDAVFPQTAPLQPEDFTLSAHGTIFRRMRELYDSGRGIDIIELIDLLDRNDELAKVGDAAYLTELTDGLPERPDISKYVDLVRASAGRKRIAIVSRSISDQAETDPATSIAQLRLKLVSLEDEAAQYETGAADATSQEFSDDALAFKFTAQHGNDLRFTAAWGRWSYWDGLRWKHDATRMVFDLARKVCRTAAAATD